MKVLFVSHTVDGGAFKVGSHHLAREFARRGWQVAHVSTPFSPVHGLRRRGDQRRRELAIRGPLVDDEGVLHAVPRVIAPLHMTEARKTMKRCLVQIGFADADFLMIDQPLMAALIDALPRSKIVYRATDLYLQGISRKRQARVVEHAQALVATSSMVMEDLRRQRPDLPHLVLENGVEYARFSQFPRVRRDGAVYVGAIDQRFDWGAVIRVAQSIAPMPVVIAGPVRLDVPNLPTNVKLVGPIPYEDVPALLGRSAIGLLPFSEDSVNEGRSPMKYFEYLAAGLNIVGRETTELKRRGAPGVYLYNGPTALRSAVAAAIIGSVPNIEGALIAAENDWEKRAERLEEFILDL